MKGSIKTYLPEKLYGFIDGDDGKSYFFHANDLMPEHDRSELAEQRYVSFDQQASPKGYKAQRITLLDAGSEIRYTIPDRVLTSKHDAVNGWEIVDLSRWIVHGSCRHSPDSAKQALVNGAQQIGANGLVRMNYYKTTGSERGTGKGTHYFTIHNYQAQAVHLAKKNMSGKYTLPELSGLHDRALRVKRRLVKRTWLHRKILWGILAAAYIALAVVKPEQNVLIAAGIASVILGTLLGFRLNYHSWLQEG